MNLRNKIPFFLASLKRDKTQPIWLEYLQSDSTAFIDTGVSGNNNNLSLNMTFYIENFFEYGAIFGNYIDEASNAFRVICSENTSRFYFNANTRASNASARSATKFFGYKHTLRLEKTKLTLDGVSSSIINVNGTANNTNIALFNRSATNPYAIVRDLGLKIYSCQMYDGDVMIRDFRPCLHPKTLQPCMYDMVTKQYFFNVGTGQFEYEYTFDTLEYIESTGAQWIDTGIATTNSDFGFTLDAMPLTNSDTYPIGSRASDGGKRFFGIRSNSSSVFAYGWQWYKSSPASQSYVNVRTQMSLNWLNAKQASIGNDVVELQDAVIDNGRNITLFGVSGSLLWKGRIYSARISNNYQLVADYVPVRKLDGTVCMYDFISGEFKTNAGSGTFVAGGYAQNLEDYEKLEYLQSDGNCYIDTGIILGYDSKAILRAKTINISIAQLAFGNNINGENFTCNIGNNRINVSRFDGAKYTGSLYKDNVNVHTYTVDKSGVQVDNSIFAWDATPINFTPTLSSYLFANRALTGAANFVRAGTRVYDFKVYENEKLIQNLIPVKRKSDGVKGMLDIVSGQFLTNQGTGEFE